MRVPRDWRDDTGSTLPLVLFYAALAIGLILVVVAASSLYLERKQLFTLADGAALVGAESFDLDDVSVTAEGALRPTLRADEVAAAVRDYLGRIPTPPLEGLRVVEATTHDGASATVTLEAMWRPPVVTALVPEGIRIEVTARARAVFG
ncbi:MAG: hypothetical protein CMF56_08685 [Leifsonia sp.]|nr:hypothetical protein [Leifsonia sp.]|tara:strand:- start:51805 stop:52251 length:447 start_codon:yes stop_codon:yes gene_type:complete